jgi:hypothetical protein
MAFEKIKNVKHGSHIVELKPGYSVHKAIIAPMIGAFGAKDIKGAHLSLGWSFLTKPFVMIEDSHKHNFDQYLFFIGGDPNNFIDFDAEIELTLDGKVHSITYTSYVYIPKGLMHCPLNIKRVTKPLVFIDARLSKEASVRPVTPDAK